MNALSPRIEPDRPDGGYGTEHRRRTPLHDWRLKAAIQTVLSVVPQGHRLNYLLQRHVTRTLPVSDAELRSQAMKAMRHLDAYQRLRGRPPRELELYEFGAGWDLVIPLTYYALGVDRQVIVDIRPLARSDLVVDASQRLGALMEPLRFARPPRPIDPQHLMESLHTMGIDFRAPMDARATGLPSASVDLITSTDVLEHVPPADIVAILRECRRILRPDGLVRARVDYQDHYWYFDARIGPYHFLRHSEDRWHRFNPPLHYQNRLRHPQLLALVHEAEFDIVEDDHQRPTAEDLGQLAAVRRAPGVAEMPLEEAAIRFANVTLAPRGAAG